ncbi:hypothetical protein SNE40_008353 [Patella caerulea]
MGMECQQKSHVLEELLSNKMQDYVVYVLIRYLNDIKYTFVVSNIFYFSVCVGLRAFTPDNIGYSFPLVRKGFTFTNITQLRFKLKACNDGHIFLHEDKVADESWNFAVGPYKNSRSQIIRISRVDSIYCTHYEKILDCNEFRPFWIRWKGGLLELGKGSEFGINRMCVHTTTPIRFNYAFIVSGWGSTACWDIDIPSTVLISGWKKVPGNRMLRGLKVKSYQARSQQVCADRCATPTEDLPCGCVEYSYNKITKQCLVVDESETSTIVTATDWRTWQLM